MQEDRDGDRVGDLCDPEPDVGRQKLILFDGFVTQLDARWDHANDERVVGDELVLDALGASREVSFAYTLAQDWFIIASTSCRSGRCRDARRRIATRRSRSRFSVH